MAGAGLLTCSLDFYYFDLSPEFLGDGIKIQDSFGQFAVCLQVMVALYQLTGEYDVGQME
jgi:hypothetical protein